MLNMISKLGVSQVLIINLCLVIDLIDSAVLNNILPPCEKLTKSERNFEEYHLEHQVTKQEAIAALWTMNDSFFDAPLPLGCKAILCNQNVMKYCLGPQFINDHCWCEQGHANEGLPFVPHTCYVGDKITETSVGSCFAYNEIKECCCDRALAKRWKFLSSSPSITVNLGFIWILLLAVSVTSKLLIS